MASRRVDTTQFLVTIGRDPDHPDQVDLKISHRSGAVICLAAQAEVLRFLADRFDDQHRANGVCPDRANHAPCFTSTNQTA